MNDKTNSKSESALREERILKFWNENKIFEKTLNLSKKKRLFGRTKEFVFYEGPPTANGKPGIHHLEARAFKDVIPRYKTMRGYHVRRKGGWDTHGLPVELQVEKKLGLTSKKAIEEYGIAKFNKECKASVWEYTDLWEKFTERIGFWLDQENPYVTYHNDYIESVWNVIKEADKQKLLYKDYKVVSWCPRCGTALSSHELAQGYEDVKDLSVYVKFKVIGENDISTGSLSPSALGALPLGPSACETLRQKHIFTDSYILAWTTTLWTLPGNVALAVGERIDYVKINLNNENLILAKERLSVIEGEYKVLEEFKGKDLIGLEYEPLYPYLKNQIEGKDTNLEKAYKVYPADFVTTEDGTGVVHTAVMYGQDDFVLGTEIGLPKHHLVGLDGKFLPGTDFLAGKFVRDEEVAVDIIKDLAGRGLLLKKEKYEHSYPHCWRCKTALIYYARDSWYIRMSSLRDKLVKENEKINWEPNHIKEGRFGEWLREIKDWAISRERYWGTPLPVWTCNKCQKVEVFSSVEDIKKKTRKSGNKYFVMRHGEAESNVVGYISSDIEGNHLTDNGKEQVKNSVKKLNGQKIDIVFCSPLVRTKETSELVKKALDLDVEIIYEEKIREINFGNYEKKKISENSERNSFSPLERFFTQFPSGESHNDVKKRIGDFLYTVDLKYQNKNILIITHGDPFLLTLAAANSLNPKETVASSGNYPKTAEIRDFTFSPLPHNENYELDLHKPYIDEVELVCAHSTGSTSSLQAGSGQACGGKLIRSKEVMDVWLDSGSMPFAQDHFPFDFAQGKPFGNKKLQYPADFISEAIDQTRGWFYTLHAVGVLMGRGKAFKNVICLGHILDEKGKKMSKSIGNIVDPWEMIEKYGVDTLRMWMYSINQPGESKNFDEKTVAELHNKVFNLLYNVLAFYELYRDVSLEHRAESLRSNNILDKWIVVKMEELNTLCTEKIEDYKLLEPARAIRDFIGDLSTWYLRRSRDRIKSSSAEGYGRTKDGDDAKKTLYYVLKTLAKIMAPFAPFTAEDIWQKLKNDPRQGGASNDKESVHLTRWPTKKFKIFSFGKRKVLKNMETVRNIVTLGLEARQKAGIKVRQPLNKLEIVAEGLSDKYLEIIKDELNVKSIKYILKIKIGIQKVTLDTKITPELKQEGNCRELIRAIQDIRKKIGLTPNDKISLFIETDEKGEKLIKKFEEDIKKVVLADKIELKNNDGQSIEIDDLIFKINPVRDREGSQRASISNEIKIEK